MNSTVSDLFFMVDNSEYWVLLQTKPEEADESLHQQAEEFCILINSLQGFDITPREVVEDYLNRV